MSDFINSPIHQVFLSRTLIDILLTHFIAERKTDWRHISNEPQDTKLSSRMKLS